MEHEDEKERRGIQSIEVGGQLLVALARGPGPMMLKDLARTAGMTSAKAHPYLVSFSRLGLVEQDPATGRYELGPLALELGLTSLQRYDPVRVASHAIAELAAATGQTVALAVWGNMGPTIVRLVESSRPIHVNLRTGTVMSPVLSATGRAFCAFLPAARAQAVIRDELDKLADSEEAELRLTQAQVDDELATVRRRGLARAVGRPVPSVNAFSAPVFDHSGSVVLVITVLGPAGQFATAWDGPIAAAVRECAAGVSQRLGHRAAA